MTKRMLGKQGHPVCGPECCGFKGRGKKHRRLMKRSERQVVRKMIREGEWAS